MRLVVVVTSVYETPYPSIESAVSEINRIYNDLAAGPPFEEQIAIYNS